MNANLWTQLLIAVIPAIITGAGSLFIALRDCSKINVNFLWSYN